MKAKIKYTTLFFFGLATLLLTGCMGYRMGGSQPVNIDSVHVAPIVNKTLEPAIELQVTRALRERIQFDGRLKLQNTEEKADAVIEVTLTQYNLRPIAFRDDLKTTPDQYRIRIKATAVLIDSNSGEVLSKSNTYGEARFFFESDLTTSKRIALPVAAEELARFMADDLIEQW